MKPERLTTEAVAALLGIKPGTVRAYASRGQMPKPSPCPSCKTLTWDRAELDAWTKRRLFKPS